MNFRPKFKFLQLNFFSGNPVPVGELRQVVLVYLQRVRKFEGAAPPNGRNVVSRKISTWVAQYEPLQLLCLWTKVHLFFLSQLGRGISLLKFFFQIFDMTILFGDMRDQSQKLSKMAPKFGRFLALPNFLERAFQKLHASYHLGLARQPWSISSACKNFRAQHPLRAEIQYPKKCILLGPNSHVIPSRQWTKVHRTFFVKRRRNFPSSYVFPILDMLPRSGDIRTQDTSVPKHARDTSDPVPKCINTLRSQGHPDP